MYTYEAAPFAVDLAVYTARGGDHLRQGIPNQDAAGSRLVGPYAIGAVADGIGVTSLFREEATRPTPAGRKPTASQLAVACFLDTAAEIAEVNHSAWPEGVARMALAGANVGVRKAKESGKLPASAHTTFVGFVANLATGETTAISLGDSTFAVGTAAGLRQLNPHHGIGNEVTKALSGADEMSVPSVVTVPAPNHVHQLVAHTDGLTILDSIIELRPDLHNYPPDISEPDRLVREALSSPDASKAARNLADVVHVTASRIVQLNGMLNDTDDMSAAVLRIWRRNSFTR